MIENGHLVHGPIDSSLLAWQPESFVVTGLLLAVLATALSYQSTSLAYDFFFGIKPKGEVAAPEMHMLLLADEGSPLSVAAAIFRHDEFDRARFHGDIPKSTTIVRSRARTARLILAKLFFVLLAAPFVNLVSVFLTLERDEKIPFLGAGFGPVGFGFDRHKNLSLVFDEFASKCLRARTSFSHAADEHAQFFFCFDVPKTVDLEEPVETNEIIIRALPNGELFGTLRVRGATYAPSLNAHIDIFSSEEVYRVANAFSQKDLQDLVDEMALFLGDGGCPSFVEVTPIAPPTEATAARPVRRKLGYQPRKNVRLGSRQGELSASQIFECKMLTSLTEQDPKAGAEVAGAALGITFEKANLTLVDTDVFRVINNRDLPVDGSAPTWFDGSELTLLNRRTHYVPVGILFIVVGVIVVARLLAECLTNNDIYDGIDEVIAQNIGLSNSHALIRSDRLLRYDHKYQRGLAGHYGRYRPGFPEVHSFRGGAVGLGGPESSGGSPDQIHYGHGEEIYNPNPRD